MGAILDMAYKKCSPLKNNHAIVISIVNSW